MRKDGISEKIKDCMLKGFMNEPMFINKIYWALENNKDKDFIFNLISERLKFLKKYNLYFLPSEHLDYEIFENDAFVLDLDFFYPIDGVLEKEGEDNKCPRCGYDNIRTLWNTAPYISIGKYFQCRTCNLYYYFCGIEHSDGSVTHWD